MTIKSIDMQVLVQRIGDVSRMQQAQQVGHTNRQEEFNKNINEQTDKYSKTVNQPGESRHKRIDGKEEKEKEKPQKRFGSGSHKEDEKAEDTKLVATTKSGHKLDITI